MTDKVFLGFLTRQRGEALALAQESDLVEVLPWGDPLVPERYVLRFRCRGLVRDFASGKVSEADRFEVGVWFPEAYQRRANPFEVLTWLRPLEAWHPNIAWPHICVGRLLPGTGLVDLVYQVFEIITYQKLTMREDDALNKAACDWARRNQRLFPVDDRPLKRRALALTTEDAPAREGDRG